MLFRSVADRIKKTVGFRLNNPGNVERGQSWLGLAPVQQHGRYATFIAPEFGIRVIAYLLAKYQRDYGVNTIRQFVSKYAPEHENPIDAYITNLARWVGVNPDTTINLVALAPRIVRGVIAQEIGYGEQPYPDSVIDTGIAMAADSTRAEQFAAIPSSLPSASLKLA